MTLTTALLHSVTTAFALFPIARVLGSERLQVVYAGFGRSGTHSLAAALKRLGYSACHGRDISINILGSHQSLAEAFIDHDVDAMIERTEELGYNATLEMHGMFWREIMERRPDAKVIFVIRDYDKWIASMMQVYWTMRPLFRYPLRFVSFFAAMAEFYASLWAYNLQVSRDDGWKHAMEPFDHEQVEKLRLAYDRFVLDAGKVLSRGQKNTLLFQLGEQGYPVLCKFLEIPAADCPDEEFPHIFSSQEVIVSGYLMRLQEVMVVILPLLATWVIYKLLASLWRWLVNRREKVKHS